MVVYFDDILVFRTFNGKFIVVYFDDIFVFSKNKEDHLSHLRGQQIVLEFKEM